MNLNQYIDHTKLGPTVSLAQIDQLIAEAIKYQFKSVCVSPVWVKYAKEKLASTNVLVCTVVGFPHGTSTTKVKIYETKEAVKDGADEIDMVVHVADVKAQNKKAISKEIKGIVKAAAGRTVKVIIETAYLEKKEITSVSKLAIKAGAHFVKTSTGYAPSGANVTDVKLMKKVVGDAGEIKASGGIRSMEDAKAMIEAGATRLGTSSGVSLMEGEKINGNTTY
ncbi:deoxyribose-phosphate aldolase [Acholeplasma equirhinis]|uniref:deoxyribose-phosphate aldolase n=1 Tax=Acholeplasma equirhinis TaxID=555393 RepID=UPI00197AE555|nr:deoxyribose-phosphate aldolase [Acholeplasma equirhinis]MBN3490381.1 deoxyribose-phosphate aldolase [Acholeplasma equirhinis]